MIEPELEAWVFSDSPHVAEALGWSGRTPDLATWLREGGFWEPGRVKPEDPKRAVDEALREARVRRSSSIYRTLAGKVSLQRCRDASFLNLRGVLQQWFPIATAPSD